MKNIIVEGNIGSGKSTFLHELEKRLAITTIQEPVHEWFKVKDENETSLFENFYQSPSKYAFLLQMNILSTRFNSFEQHQTTFKITNVFERSILTDKHIFVPSLSELEYLSIMEQQVFENVYDSMKSQVNRIHGIIYLQCDPTVSYQRVRNRNRKGEDGVTLDYLQRLHTKHEDWLLHEKDIPVFVLDVSNKTASDCIREPLVSFLQKIEI